MPLQPPRPDNMIQPVRRLSASVSDLATNCEKWGFAAGHVLVNEERSLFGRPKMRRNPTLDRLSKQMAQQVVDQNCVSCVEFSKRSLQASLGARHVAQIVQRGDSIRSMHKESMKGPSRKTILSLELKEFGMGTAKDLDGSLVLVQLFRS